MRFQHPYYQLMATTAPPHEYLGDLRRLRKHFPSPMDRFFKELQRTNRKLCSDITTLTMFEGFRTGERVKVIETKRGPKVVVQFGVRDDYWNDRILLNDKIEKTFDRLINDSIKGSVAFYRLTDNDDRVFTIRKLRFIIARAMELYHRSDTKSDRSLTMEELNNWEEHNFLDTDIYSKMVTDLPPCYLRENELLLQAIIRYGPFVIK